MMWNHIVSIFDKYEKELVDPIIVAEQNISKHVNKEKDKKSPLGKRRKNGPKAEKIALENFYTFLWVNSGQKIWHPMQGNASGEFQKDFPKTKQDDLRSELDAISGLFFIFCLKAYKKGFPPFPSP